MSLRNLTLDEEEYVALLTKLIQHSSKVQNNPPELIPQECLPAGEVIEFLKDFTVPNGPIKLTKFEYAPGRTNLVLELIGSGKDKSVVSFVGSHLDVVPADPEEWDFDPFTLGREGDKVTGRGVTDCLGHVALIACLFKSIVQQQILLKTSVKAVFIASEENSTIPNIGVDEMMARGDLDTLNLKNGPLIWVDSANFGPTMGSAGAAAWQITATGKLFHSGLPHKAINAIELANDTVKALQTWFHHEFDMSEKERQYLYQIGSSLKPTQISTPPGGLNQIPGSCNVKGDIRLTPFYDMGEVQKKVEHFIANLDLSTLPGSKYSKYHLPEESLKGSVKIQWLGDAMQGIACDLESIGFKALDKAIQQIHGADRKYSITGSLPLVNELKEAGYDVQICGFGRMDAYHATNEYAMISEMGQGFRILCSVIADVESTCE